MHVAKSFTQKLPLGKASDCAVPERSVTPTQYVALALRRVPHIFLGIYIHISAHAGISISMVLVSVGLTSLAQLLTTDKFH